MLGTHTLLECARASKKIKLFIHVSTDEVTLPLAIAPTPSLSLLSPTPAREPAPEMPPAPSRLQPTLPAGAGAASQPALTSGRLQVYGDVFGEGAVENAILEPTNPYSCSKAAAEFICKVPSPNLHACAPALEAL